MASSPHYEQLASTEFLASPFASLRSQLFGFLVSFTMTCLPTCFLSYGGEHVVCPPWLCLCGGQSSWPSVHSGVSSVAFLCVYVENYD